VKNGLQPETGVDDSIKTMKVIEALTLSAQRRRDVSLDEIESKYGPLKLHFQKIMDVSLTRSCNYDCSYCNQRQDLTSRCST